MQVVQRLIETKCSKGLISAFNHPLFQLLLKESEIPLNQLKKMAYGGFSSPYYFCFHLAISQLLAYLLHNGKISEPVDFISDDRDDGLKPCIKLYDRIRKLMPPELKAIAGDARSGNDRSEPALQLADLLAGQVIANVRAGKPEPTLQTLASCRTILKCRIEPEDLSRFKATLHWANKRWRELGLDVPRK